MAAVTLDKLSKTYRHKGRADNHAVVAVDLRIEDGEIISLLGSSGCGKTSTLRMIAGFESISSGSIRIGERSVGALKPAQRGVAMAFEGYALYPPLTVYDNIAFSLLRARTPRQEVRARVQQVAELLEIGALLDAYPPTLSGGQQQRVSLARALVRNADLYLFDEPMSQLEPQLRALLRARIKDHLIARRMTAVFVTHDQTEAVALSDRIAVMSEGLLQQYASPPDLKQRPANLFVAGFIGEPAMNLLPARLARSGGALQALLAAPNAPDAAAPLAVGFGASARIPAALAALPEGHALQLGLRPHKIRLLAGGDQPAGDCASVLRGTLAFNQWQGDQSHVGVKIGDQTLLVVTDDAVELAPHSPVAVQLPVAALHLFDGQTGLALLHGADL